MRAFAGRHRGLVDFALASVTLSHDCLGRSGIRKNSDVDLQLKSCDFSYSIGFIATEVL
jgi:hypothetical protein